MASKMAENHEIFIKMHNFVEFYKFYRNFNKDYLLNKISVFYNAFYSKKWRKMSFSEYIGFFLKIFFKN